MKVGLDTDKGVVFMTVTAKGGAMVTTEFSAASALLTADMLANAANLLLEHVGEDEEDGQD